MESYQTFRYYIKIMFQNTFQNGHFFQLFDPKIPQDKIKHLYKFVNLHHNNKIFDKLLKTYVLEFTTSNAKIAFPRQDKKDLYLIQQFLIFQIYFFPAMSWTIQFVITDLTKTKRRIIISSNSHKLQVKPFFVKFPCPPLKEGAWTTLAFDLFSFMNAFKGQTYRSLDAIYITGHYKLRRIYTTNIKPFEEFTEEQENKLVNFLPKNFYYPQGIDQFSSLVAFDENLMMEHVYEPTQPSTKNCSNIKSRLKVQTPMTDVTVSQKVTGYKKQKKFLANTNGPQTLNRNKKADLNESSQGEATEKSIKTPMTTDKNLKNRKSVGRNYFSKKKPSIYEKKEEKMKTKAKLNPWRGQKQTDVSQYSISKHENERNIQSAQTTLFKTKNNLVNKFNDSKNKGFGGKSDHYSDSEYIELSQKFSTVTDGKFFKNEYGSNVNEWKEENQQDEIQENIQMQTNSVQSNSPKIIRNEFPIEQSIVDSFQNEEADKKIPKKQFEEMALSSHYGFGERMMNRFIKDIERPYSPPLGEKQLTQETIDRNEVANRQEVEVIYDPVLNCYYDHRTHTYYELKN